MLELLLFGSSKVTAVQKTIWLQQSRRISTHLENKAWIEEAEMAAASDECMQLAHLACFASLENTQYTSLACKSNKQFSD